MLSITENLKYKINHKIKSFDFYIFYNKFLMIKSKYFVVEPYYMDYSTPDGPVVFSGSSILNNKEFTCDI